MDTENRLELMRNSKIARKIGQINEQRDVINKLISVELQALEEKKSFHYSEEGEELDGSEPQEDLTGKDWRAWLRQEHPAEPGGGPQGTTTADLKRSSSLISFS